MVSTFEEIYDEAGVAEAHGIAILLTKYKTVACIYMLCDVLHNVAALHASLQAKDIDLASLPAMVESTTKRLMELKENVNTCTWFKNHSSVFTDDVQLGAKKLWSQRKKRTCFFTWSTIRTCKVLLTTLIGWSLQLLSLLCLFLIHDISQLKINWQTMA